MATPKEYFETDFRHVCGVKRTVSLKWSHGQLSVVDCPSQLTLVAGIPNNVYAFGQPVSISGTSDLSHITFVKKDMENEEAIEITIAGYFDPASLTKFMSFYIPNSSRPLKWLIAVLALLQIGMKATVDFVSRQTNTPGEKPIDSTEAVFIGRVFVYTASEVSAEDREYIQQLSNERGFRLHIRDRDYAMQRETSEKPLAFISHDSRDKDEIAVKLASLLRSAGCPVWYDEYSLRVGDSLRESIERGLKECERCILVITPNFLGNTGWTKVEFNSIFTREILERRNIVLPIWHNVTPQQVFDYSPSLADRIAVNWSKGAEEVAKALLRVLLS